MNKKASNPVSQQTAEGTPGWFAREVLKFTPYDWQDEVLWDLAVGTKPVVLKAANGSGKTQGIASVAVLWHCAVFPKSQVVTTAGVYRQVKEQLWGNLRTHKDKLGSGWQINTTDLLAPNGSRAIGFSTDDAAKFEGWHNDNLLIILDEAKSIPDEIWEAVQRCNAPRIRILVMSSTGTTDGFFAEAFHQKRKFFSTHSVTAYDCPHLSEEWIEGQLEYWKPHHPLVRSMIFSEFREATFSDYVISAKKWAECLDNPPDHQPAPRMAFIDWAAGGDENVVAIMHGNKVDELICWRDTDTMASANRAAVELSRRGISMSHVWADDGGLGHPINDALAKNGMPVRRLLNNWKPTQKDHFANLGAELWFEAARLIERREVILLDDEILMQQATSRMVATSVGGKLGLEKKEEMRARGLSSPDRADAVLLLIAVAKKFPPVYDDPLSDIQFDREVEEYSNFWPGAFAGV